MSGHRRVKDIDYDDDDVEDYDEEDYDGDGVASGNAQEGMSAEDEEQMRAGSAKVRAALGDTVSDNAIQEALWHYWFDAEKTIVYLKNQSSPKQPKTTKQNQTSRFDQAANAAAATQSTPQTKKDKMDPSDWFKDVPWFNVPSSALGQLTEPARPRLRLLGGSASSTGKPSKLAALAAARKKKEAEQKENTNPLSGNSEKASSAAALLSRLGAPRATDAPPAELNDNATSSKAAQQENIPKSYPIRKRKSTSPPPVVPELAKTQDPVANDTTLELQAKKQIRGQPSIFAKTMCGEMHPASASSTFTHDLQSSLYGSHDLAEANPFSGPSPDDVVAQAQAKGNKKQQHPVKNVKDKATDGIAAMALEDPPPSVRVKSKNLDVLKEFDNSSRKNEASFVVIGHVDHGKSTLMGRLLCDFKVVDQRSVDKYRKEAETMGKSSFALAWVMDSTAEERERGVTVDIATNYFETEKTRFTILDAPGHRDFVPNMIAGASQADFAVLVIDAATNSFEAGLRGQTKEHALLVRSMGVQRVIVAVNKMDTVSWAEERFEEIKQQVSAFMLSAGFKEDNIEFVPCAGLTGENIVTKAPAAASWYTHNTLVQALEDYKPSKAQVSRPFRLQINDVFRGGVINPVSISGKIEAGNVQIGDSILAMPAGETATIKGIDVEHESRDWAVAGQIVDLHLTDIDPVHLKAGDIGCDPSKPVRNVTSFTTKILAFEHVYPMQIDIHRGRLHVPGRISQLVGTLDKSSGEITKKRPKIIQPGSVARVKIELDAPVPLEVPWRVVLRSGGATVAAGVLEQVNP